MKLKALLGVWIALGLAGSAMADIIDFGTTSGYDSGTISYQGGTNPLVGANILIASVYGKGTPSNSGPTFAVVNGVLSFTTGNFVSYDTNTATYTFGGGGSLTITGTGPGCATLGGCPGDTNQIASGSTLLSGSVIAATVQGGSFNIVLAAGNDTKDTLLLNFFGEPQGLPWAFSGSIHVDNTIPVPTDATNPAGFTVATSGSTDIKNQVPDGGMTVMLLGGALAGLEGLRRRLVA